MSKIKVGFIGCGRISDVHYLAYKNNPDAELYAVCDMKKETVDKRMAEWNAKKGYTDYKEMLADKNLDAVEIITTTNTHELIAMDAIKAGKHVALQKPMTPTVEGAERLVAAAAKTNLIFKVTDNYVHYPPMAFAKKIIEDGVIGTPHNIRIKMFAGNDKYGWEVPRDTWGWRAKENQAGRPRQTFDHGHHLWAVSWYLMGEIEKVFAWIDYIDEGDVDSPAAVMWKYKDKYKMGMCEYCYSEGLSIPTKYYACDEWFEVTGTKGMVTVNRCTGNILDGPSVSLFTNDGWKHYSDIKADWSEGFIEAGKNFINAIKGKEAPLLSGAQGLEILKFDFAIQKASREKKEIFIKDIK